MTAPKPYEEGASLWKAVRGYRHLFVRYEGVSFFLLRAYVISVSDEKLFPG